LIGRPREYKPACKKPGKIRVFIGHANCKKSDGREGKLRGGGGGYGYNKKIGASEGNLGNRGLTTRNEVGKNSVGMAKERELNKSPRLDRDTGTNKSS